MYSMKEKYRQNTNLKSSTSTYSSTKYYDRVRTLGNTDKPRKHPGEEKARYYNRERTPESTNHDKLYSMKRDHHNFSNSLERARGEKRNSKVLDRHDSTGYHRSRIDYHQHDTRDSKHKLQSSRAKDHSTERKPSVFANLSRVVHKARETRTGDWNGEVNKQNDEINSKRWSHSGYKELYRGEHKPSNNESNIHHRRSGSGSRQFMSSNARHPDRQPQRQESRSRSPIDRASIRKPAGAIRRSDNLRKGQNAGNFHTAKPSSEISSTIARPEKTATRVKAGNGNLKSTTKPLQTVGAAESRGISRGKNSSKQTELATIKSLRADRERLFGKKLSPSPSDSLSSDSDKVGHAKADSKQKRYTNGSRSRSRSLSLSTSSKSSDDEDVLDLHPRKRRKSASKTYTSSSYDSDSSAISCLASNPPRKSPMSVSSASSASSSSRSRSERSKERLRTEKLKGKKPLPAPKAPNKNRPINNNKSVKSAEKHPVRTSEESLSSGNVNKQTSGVSNPSGRHSGESSKKLAEKTTSKGLSKKVETSKSTKSGSGSQKKSQGKKAGGRAESESESSSSSESDAEPRMSLSERFAKLTQMHTDKREFAKPVLSVNEIDTKMKVVRDLRNPETKVYVDNPRPASSPVREIRRRSRPKTPEIAEIEGRAKYTSDDRRRHFERMDKDEPTERPADWSDPRVRYSYYRDRGYFNERPLEFEEYVKWEKWWYDYRDWLANQGYYDRMANPQQQLEREPPRVEVPDGRSGWHYDRRDVGPMRHGPPPPVAPEVFDARERIVRHPSTMSGRGQFINPRGGGHPYYPNDMNMVGPAISRHIGRTANGSLVINIRPGNTLTFPSTNYNYRGRGRGRGQFR